MAPPLGSLPHAHFTFWLPPKPSVHYFFTLHSFSYFLFSGLVTSYRSLTTQCRARHLWVPSLFQDLSWYELIFFTWLLLALHLRIFEWLFPLLSHPRSLLLLGSSGKLSLPVVFRGHLPLDITCRWEYLLSFVMLFFRDFFGRPYPCSRLHHGLDAIHFLLSHLKIWSNFPCFTPFSNICQ